MGKQHGVCAGLPAIPAYEAGKLPRKAVTGCQGKAMEWGEKRKYLTLPMKMKGLINPWRSMSLHQVSLYLTSTGMLTVSGGIFPQVHGASVHQGCFNKRIGPILSLGMLEAKYCSHFAFAEEGVSLPCGSVPQPAGL